MSPAAHTHRLLALPPWWVVGGGDNYIEPRPSHLLLTAWRWRCTIWPYRLRRSARQRGRGRRAAKWPAASHTGVVARLRPPPRKNVANLYKFDNLRCPAYCRENSRCNVLTGGLHHLRRSACLICGGDLVLPCAPRAFSPTISIMGGTSNRHLILPACSVETAGRERHTLLPAYLPLSTKYKTTT